jgi:Na+/H+ antiporter NhaD/arsenite permease-like protein
MLALLFAAWPRPAAASGGAALGEVLPLWSGLPFAGILLSIAFVPLVAPKLWHRHYARIAAAWAAAFVLPFVFLHGSAALQAIAHTLLVDYVPFVLLLATLFTICGGIVVRGRLHGTPRTNTTLLGIGTLLASCIGTTGASMVLVRPLLRANAGRARRAHILVFFIFLVANIGGVLTPLGDPPLFLGFLRGVPFFWTLRLAPHLLLAASVLLAVFYVIDRRFFAAETRFPRPAAQAPGSPSRDDRLRIAGAVNIWLLGGVLVAVLLSGSLRLGTWHVGGIEFHFQNIGRDVALVLLAWISLRISPRSLRAENEFGWGPMREVAILFAAIFVTMIPPLAILAAGEHGALAPVVRTAGFPAQYFWLTGGLSSFLDNAPTYLTFVATAAGRCCEGLPERQAMLRLVAEHPRVLAAISAGAVFMGAMTYVGNAPNFMVRSIAEEAGVAMPSFFGYLLRWSLPVLVPVFLLITGVFFR